MKTPVEPNVPTWLAGLAVPMTATAQRGVAASARAATLCWCERRSRGLVPGAVVGDVDVPAHDCLECSPEHCWHARDARRCRFGTCTLQAEAELPHEQDVTGQSLRVCTLHVGPALSWGRVEPISQLEVRWLDQGRGAAA